MINLETAYVIDNLGNILFSTTSHSAEFVKFTSEQINLMNGQTMIHNHPSGTTFSPDDLELLVNAKLREIRVCTVKRTFSLVYKNDSKYKEYFATDYNNAITSKKQNLDKSFAQLLDKYETKKIGIMESTNECIKMNFEMENYREKWLEDYSAFYGYIYGVCGNETIKTTGMHSSSRKESGRLEALWI